MSRPRYTLRVSVKVHGTMPITGLEKEPTITVGQRTVTVKQRSQYLILLARDFNSEAEAEAFLDQIKAGLWNLAIEYNIAFDADFQRRTIQRPDHPEQAARNVARSFGLPIEEPVQPLQGLSDEQGYTIFQSDENIRFFAFGTVIAYESTGWENAREALAEGIRNARLRTDGQDIAFATAMDLYLSSFYETTIRARFLTLMMCLEVLAPVTQRHPAAVRALCELNGLVDAQVKNENDEEARDALDALLREIDFKKETSIRRRVRRLILDEAPLGQDANEARAKAVVEAYDLRGTMVHTGVVESDRLREANNTALQAVKLILRARLGLSSRA